jgi:pyruvate/2-oxoacid:ferredoxin oxidoreductase alpha subunit
MGGAIHRNLRMFGELCGDKSAKNVVIVTTMWDKARNQEEASKRENSLKERYWNVLLYHQASVARFQNNQDSAWEIIDQVIQTGRDRTAVLLQEEMVTLGRNLNETKAGKALYRDLQGLLEKQNQTMHLLAEKAEGAQTPEDVDAEMNKLRGEIDTLLKEVEGMQVPFGRRLALFFGKALGKKAQAVIQRCSHLFHSNSCIF